MLNNLKNFSHIVDKFIYFDIQPFFLSCIRKDLRDKLDRKFVERIIPYIKIIWQEKIHQNSLAQKQFVSKQEILSRVDDYEIYKQIKLTQLIDYLGNLFVPNVLYREQINQDIISALDYQGKEYGKTNDQINVVKNLEGQTLPSLFDEMLDTQILLAGNQSTIEEQYQLFSEQWKLLNVQATEEGHKSRINEKFNQSFAVDSIDRMATPQSQLVMGRTDLAAEVAK